MIQKFQNRRSPRVVSAPQHNIEIVVHKGNHRNNLFCMSLSFQVLGFLSQTGNNDIRSCLAEA